MALLAADVENKYICSRAVDPRHPPTFDLVSRVNGGVNGLRRQPFDPQLKGPVVGAGGGLLPFPAADLARVYLVWDLAAEMYDAVANKAANIAHVRDWTALLLGAPGVPVRVQLDGTGTGYVLASVGSDGVSQLFPYYVTQPLFPSAAIPLAFNEIHRLSAWAPALVTAPVAAPAVSQKVEVVVSKETRLLNDGTLRYREQFWSGSDFPSHYWALEGAKKAGMLAIPEPFQLSNPQLALDAHWLPYCVTMPNAMALDHFLEVYGQQLQEFFSVHLSLERVLDSKNKTVIKLFAPNIAHVRTMARCICESALSTHAWTPHMTGMIRSLHTHLGQMLRRSKFPAVKPSVEKSDCPLWYFKDHPTYRPAIDKEKRGRDSDED